MSPDLSFIAGGLRCFRSDEEPSTFFYLPEAPSPHRDPQGRPVLSVWAADDWGMLQLESRWAAAEEQLEAARAALGERFGEEAAASFELQPAPATVREVVLWQGDGSGSLERLHTASSSGFPPFPTVFNLRLDAEQKERAVACLNGRRGFLALSYEISLERVVRAAATLEGEVTQAVAELGVGATREECRTLIDEALLDGRLLVTLEADEGAPESLRRQVVEEAQEKAAVILHGMGGGEGPAAAGETRIRALAVRSARLPVEESKTTDLSGWFEAGEGVDHVKVLPGGRAIGTPDTPPTGGGNDS